MVGTCQPAACKRKRNREEEREKRMTLHTSHKGKSANRAPAKCIAAANRGWMSEKYLPSADQVKCFLLTSPFIEPATRRRIMLTEL